MGQLSAAGHELTNQACEADVIVVNTCSFIDPAKQESVDTILEMAEHKKTGRARKLIVAGCLVERYRDDIREEHAGSRRRDRDKRNGEHRRDLRRIARSPAFPSRISTTT